MSSTAMNTTTMDEPASASASASAIVPHTSLGAAIASNFKQDAAQRVAFRTGGFALLGGLTGAGAASMRFGNPATAALQSAASTGTSAFAFFAVREYLAVPALAHWQATNQIQLPTSRILAGVPESSLAGFGAGTILSGYHFGIGPRLLSGGITFALVGSIGQITFNQLDDLRIRYLSRLERSEAIQQQQQEDANESPKPPLLQRVTDAIFSVTPIRKVSDEEYTKTLKGKIETTKRELQSVDGEVERIELRLQQLTRKV